MFLFANVSIPIANGSGRKPAQYNGCFSIRPSTGVMDTDGVVGQFPFVIPLSIFYVLNPGRSNLSIDSRQFDMPVFFGRDLSRFPEFIDVWYGNSPLLKMPSKVNIH